MRKKMGRSKESKWFHYVKMGNLHRVRSLLLKYKHLTNSSDRKGRTALHMCCLLGDDAMMKLLLKYGADPGALDDQGNTSLHYALKYALQTTLFCTYNELILPLLKVGRHLLDIKNSESITARQCLGDLKRQYDQRKEETEAIRQEEVQKEYEHIRRQDEREWQRKLQFEVSQSYCEALYSDDYSDRKQSYDEWANEIWYKRRQKQAVNEPKKFKAECKHRQQEQKVKEKSKKLQIDPESYSKQTSENDRRLRLSSTLTTYEIHCQKVFNSKSETALGFSEIPWPFKPTSNTDEMIHSIVEWSEMKTGEERKKFLREQQVRWHPDRFLQRCGCRLLSKDREKIVEQVKSLSQRINALFDETV